MVVHVSNHSLLQFMFSEHLATVTSRPTRTEGIPLLVQPTWRFDRPQTLNSFFLVPVQDCFDSLGLTNSPTSTSWDNG